MPTVIGARRVAKSKSDRAREREGRLNTFARETKDGACLEARLEVVEHLVFCTDSGTMGNDGGL